MRRGLMKRTSDGRTLEDFLRADEAALLAEYQEQIRRMQDRAYAIRNRATKRRAYAAAKAYGKHQDAPLPAGSLTDLEV